MLSCENASSSKGQNKETMSGEKLGAYQGLGVVSEVPATLVQIADLVSFSAGGMQADLQEWLDLHCDSPSIHPPLE